MPAVSAAELPVRAAASIVLAVLVQGLIGILPATGSVRLDVFLGFLVAAAPLAVLAAILQRAPVGFGMLGALIGVGLSGGMALSLASLPYLAGPMKALGALSAGRMLGDRVPVAWWLAAAAVAVLVVDTWSVLSGPSRLVLEEAPSLLDYLLVHFPALGRSVPGAGVGMSDLAIVALFTVAAAGTGLRARLTFGALWLSLPAALGVALIFSRPLPALPFVAVALLLTNGDRLWLSAREEWCMRRTEDPDRPD